MPTYKFQCPCGLQFSATVKASKATEPKDCPECGSKASRMAPSSISGHFHKSVTGPIPQNTGIHDLDTHIDRVIGQSAQQGKDVIEKRQALKRKILNQNPKSTGSDLSRNLDGSYRILDKKEKGVHDRANKINKMAMDHFLKEKPP